MATASNYKFCIRKEMMLNAVKGVQFRYCFFELSDALSFSLRIVFSRLCILLGIKTCSLESNVLFASHSFLLHIMDG